MKEFRPPFAGFLFALAASFFYGLWPAAVRGVYAAGGDVGFVLFTMTWTRGLMMGVFCLATQRHLFVTRESVKQGLVGGFFQAVCLGALYASLKFISGPLAIIIHFSHTLMLLCFMAWRGEVRLNLATVVTTCAALIGLTFVLDLWHAQNAATMEGIVLAFISALATVSRLYVYGQQVKLRHPIVVGAESFLVAAAMLSPVLFFGVHPPVTWIGAGFAVLGCAAVTFASFAMFYGIALLGSFRLSLFSKMEPVFTSVFSAVLLGEILKGSQYAGIAMVLGSLALYQVFEQRHIKAA